VAALALAVQGLPNEITWEKAMLALALAALGFFARDNHGASVVILPSTGQSLPVVSEKSTEAK
jgi:hypothetical protein